MDSEIMLFQYGLFRNLPCTVTKQNPFDYDGTNDFMYRDYFMENYS